MFDEIKKIPYFTARNFRMLYTYKLALFASVISVVFNLFYMILFGGMFGITNPESISQYQGNFISYILVGSIGWSFLWSILTATSGALTEEMRLGPFESILLTPTKIRTLMFSYSLYGCVIGLIVMSLLTLIGFLLFGISVFANTTIYTLLIFFLSIVMMLGFGMIFGGLTIWLKNIGLTVDLLRDIATFFCGVYFPVAVIPEVFQPIARYIPFYYSIEGLRLSLLEGTTVSEIMNYVFILVILSIVIVFIGLVVLRIGLNKAKKDGSLAYY